MAHTIGIAEWYQQATNPVFDGRYVSAERPTAEMATEVTKGNVTWEFSQAVEYGTFIDGSPWIALNGNSVNLISTTPVSTTGRNGGMVNLTSSQNNGLDNRMQANTYDHSNNVTSSEKLPRLLTAGESYLQSVSKASSSGDNPYISEIQVLTVLATAPASGSFRPPYHGTVKTMFNESDINYSNIPSLSAPTDTTGMPTLAAASTYFQGGPYIKGRSGYGDRYWHADVNHPTGAYGRDIGRSTGQALIRLCLTGSNAEKRDLAVGVCQAGIDMYFAAQNGFNWAADGGHNQGAKTLIGFAGKILESSDLLDEVDYSLSTIFQEDQQTFYINASSVSITNGGSWNPNEANGPSVPYQSADIGRPEWAIRWQTNPEQSDMAWYSRYRQVSGAAQFQHCVAAYLMGLEADYNHSAWFDYFLNRYYIAEAGYCPATTPDQGIGGASNQISPFASNVYLTHINATPSSVVDAPSSIANVKVGQVVIA